MVLETTFDGAALLVGRALIGLVIGFMGLNHFTAIDQMAGYAATKGVPAPRLAVVGSGLLLVLGGLTIVLGVYPLVGAVALIAFFVGVTPVMHDFWTVDDPEQRQNEMINFLKNGALLGASLVILAIAGASWPYALDLGL
ncbi:MAG: DoxX family protein [Halobacteriales archaeon]